QALLGGGVHGADRATSGPACLGPAARSACCPLPRTGHRLPLPLEGLSQPALALADRLLRLAARGSGLPHLRVLGEALGRGASRLLGRLPGGVVGPRVDVERDAVEQALEPEGEGVAVVREHPAV